MNVQHLIDELKRYQTAEKENKQRIQELTRANAHIKEHIKFLEGQLKDVEQLTPPEISAAARE
jgi:predicted nuclease with TOPRIM domain